MNLLALAVVAGLFFSISAFILGRISVTRQIKKHIPNLNESTAQLMGSSEQIGLVSNDLAAASQEQLNVLTTTISTSVEIRSMIEKTNESTSFLKNESENLKNSVLSGNKIVQGMVSSSQEIQQESEKFSTEMQKSIDQLTSALTVIKEIATKTELINQIVFQTKILSFNASIEAARAGEAGKGFSVVAEEVGNLAQMSGNASDEIYKIVEKSINVVQETINTTKDRIALLTHETTEKSQAGYSHAKECEKIFNEVSDKINETTLLIGQISAATSEQTLGVTQLDKSINELKEVADRNRLVASQTTEYVSDLEIQTSNLHQTIQDLKKLDKKLAEQKVTLQKFIWNAKLELGIDQMDDEHQVLVQKINNLVTELENQYISKNKDKLLRTFHELAAYTTEHFSHEEAFMQSIGYPQFTSHKKIHTKLLAQVTKYGEDIKANRLDDQKLVSFLKGWLISHIMGVDKQYAAHYLSSSNKRVA